MRVTVNNYLTAALAFLSLTILMLTLWRCAGGTGSNCL